jgi:hypothetical protein
MKSLLFLLVFPALLLLVPFVNAQNETITIAPNPATAYYGVMVDGTPYQGSATFVWPSGSVHNVTAISPAGLSTLYSFSHWSDSGAKSHLITASANTTYTAFFSAESASSSCGPLPIIQLEAGCWLPAVIDWYSIAMGQSVFVGVILGDLGLALFLKTRNALLSIMVFSALVSALGTAVPGVVVEIGYIGTALCLSGIAYKLYTLRS